MTTTSRTIESRRCGARRAALLAGAAALALSGCGIANTAFPVSLADEDVITVVRSDAGIFGYYGGSTMEVAATTITTRYTLPDGTELYEVTDELEPLQRERVVDAAETYLEWERFAGDRGLCTDLPSTTVTVSGSTTHESSYQECDLEVLTDLRRTIEDSRGSVTRDLAHPAQEWTVEIQPLTAEGEPVADTGSAERYAFQPGYYPDLVMVQAEGAPEGWGADLAPGPEEGQRVLEAPEVATALQGINGVLLDQDRIGCGDATAEVTLTRGGAPSALWEFPVCPGQSTEELVEALRGL